MARKPTGNGTTSRSKKAAAETSTQPVVVQTAPEALKNEVRKSGEIINLVPSNRPANLAVNINIEDKIRHRAYEIYLERRATAGAENGDQNQDWLVAEQEIRS